jgi:hypothetical protein
MRADARPVPMFDGPRAKSFRNSTNTQLKPAIQRQDDVEVVRVGKRRAAPTEEERRHRSIKRGPATVLLVATGALVAGVVEYPLSHILPLGAAAIHADSVHSLDLDDALAAAA